MHWFRRQKSYSVGRPWNNVGKGTQCIIKTHLALNDKNSENKKVVLIEEPECHLSHSTLNIFLKSLEYTYQGKQIIISTHSSFVANKLGLANLLLLNNSNLVKIRELSEETDIFFRKIAGYDTLRLLLCKKAILVEGDSDELIVQKAYMSEHDGHLPIHDGIDVISVGTSFLRFLELSEKLEKEVIVITDNDGNIEALHRKYCNYIGNNQKSNIKICYDSTEHEYTGKLKNYNYNTLEPCMLRANDLPLLNRILGKSFEDEDSLLKYMKENKTESAIKIFDTTEPLSFPKYIMEAL
ncbi:ATP-dependent nuclease [Treponema phagedenis]|uniref:ATP-dependent nuclease n=1 Tax=Treponema phagedenis TaxID=162 RepID=UPI001C0664AE